LILSIFYVNNATFTRNLKAKFYLNLPQQTIVTAFFVRSPQNISVLVFFCGRRQTRKPETEVFWSDLTKAAVTIVRFFADLAEILRFDCQ